MRALVAVLIGILGASTGAATFRDDASLDAVLDRAGAYVRELQARLAAVVAEERYVQTVWDLGAPEDAPPRERVTLRSEFLLVRPRGADRYVDLRDTFEVDGRPVHDGRDRLASLLAGRGAGLGVQSIIEASARFNIGDVQRTLNVPTLPLLFLHPRFRSRFRFARVDAAEPVAPLRDENAGSRPDVFRVSTEVWALSYEETGEPTFVRTPDGDDRPVRGRLWIEPATGRVLMSELVTGGDGLDAIITVSYQSEPLLGFLVPVEMRERYEAESRGRLIEGIATYSTFRPLEP